MTSANEKAAMQKHHDEAMSSLRASAERIAKQRDAAKGALVAVTMAGSALFHNGNAGKHDRELWEIAYERAKGVLE